MSARHALILACVAAALASAAPAGAHPAANRPCGRFTDRDGTRIGAVVMRGNVECATARRVLRAYLRSDAPCDGSACVRRHYAWTCATAISADWPRLASCTRGKTRIGAYAPAD
ncbi:MAG TPA: hypothetical protein VGM91_23360 [Conexibacter sp.]|jgi:hypothetical protein